MIDNRTSVLSKNDTTLVKFLCDRKFGIGADGLILLEKAVNPGEDFQMVYFNADGNESSMCGNGGRCLVAFAKFLGIISSRAAFTAIDGFHEATIENDTVGLKMTDVEHISEIGDSMYLDTGSPHHVIFSEDVTSVDVKEKGAEVRYSPQYGSKGGTNVNFVSPVDKDGFRVRTYERGVEDETLSCGTGVTAVALAAFHSKRTSSTSVTLNTPGGDLEVNFEPVNDQYRNIWLKGPAKQVFKGEITC